ncbi:hypothetical protein [Paraburkholderia sp. C35]|uniref:hypothetical protein n=1 Tax=Paraburkholderia sp. C35 TaxID=2126993 RepID=UPI0013A53C0C|nr:hypothetical protein [Paraburkholderia sp. C35]
MRYVDNHSSHDDWLTRGSEPAEDSETDTYEDFLNRRLKGEADLDFTVPYSHSQVLQ